MRVPCLPCTCRAHAQVLTVLINVFIWDKHASPTGLVFLFGSLCCAYFYKQVPSTDSVLTLYLLCIKYLRRPLLQAGAAATSTPMCPRACRCVTRAGMTLLWAHLCVHLYTRPLRSVHSSFHTLLSSTGRRLSGRSRQPCTHPLIRVDAHQRCISAALEAAVVDGTEPRGSECATVCSRS